MYGTFFVFLKCTIRTGWAKSKRALDCFFIFMAEILRGYWQTLDRSGKKIILLHHCLKVTHANTPTPLPRFKNVIFRHHYVMQKNRRYIETEQRHLCRVLHFNRQNLCWWARLITRLQLIALIENIPTEHQNIAWDVPRNVFYNFGEGN